MRVAARCMSLGSALERCKAKAGLKLVEFMGDGEIYTYPCETRWVCVLMCKKHREMTGSKIYKEKQNAEAEKKRQNYLKRLTRANNRSKRAPDDRRPGV